MEGLTFRKATPADTERIAEIIAGEPGREAVGLTGGVELARRFGMAMARLPNGPQGWERTLLAERDGEPVGIMQASGDPQGVRLTPALALLALRVFGPLRALRLLPRVRARARVQTAPPPGCYYIGELDVDQRYRNRGIGGALLDYAEDEARRGGYRLMSLTTTTINPARRLYERHGFRVVETKTDPEYERYTGIQGRVLMAKELE